MKIIVARRNVFCIMSAPHGKPLNNQNMTTSFSNYKIAQLAPAKSDALGFFESVALSGVENQYIRVSAQDQRRYFGCTPFGKRAIKVCGSIVTVIRSVAFGTDWDEQSYQYSQADKSFMCASDFRNVGMILPR